MKKDKEIVFRESIEKRDLDLSHILLASYLGASGDMGLLDQMTTNLVMRRFAHYIWGYFKASGKVFPDPSTDACKNMQEVIDFLDQEIGLAGEYTFEYIDGGCIIRIRTKTCKLCPKGVGGAEVEGTLCPYPIFFLEFFKLLNDQVEIKLVKRGPRVPMVKEGEVCKIQYRIVPE